MNASQTLLYRRLIAFGVPTDRATDIATTGRIVYPWNAKKRDQMSVRLARNLRGLAQAEHAACVCADNQRCYHVDTTRLAMQAREQPA